MRKMQLQQIDGAVLWNTLPMKKELLTYLIKKLSDLEVKDSLLFKDVTSTLESVLRNFNDFS